VGPDGIGNAGAKPRGLVFQRLAARLRLAAGFGPGLDLGLAGLAGPARHQEAGPVVQCSRSAGRGVRPALDHTGPAAVAAAAARKGLAAHHIGSVEMAGRSPCRLELDSGIVLGRRIETFLLGSWSSKIDLGGLYQVAVCPVWMIGNAVSWMVEMEKA
jgi:hypothetical protein